MNMIEQVALAMVRKAKAGPDEVHSLDAVQMSGTEDFIALAKAAIEAMREPTQEMLEAATDWHDHVAADETYPMARGVIRAALGAALEDHN